MSFAEDKKKVEELYYKNNGQLTEEDKENTENLHYSVFGERLPNCNCVNRWSDALDSLMIYFRNHKSYDDCRYSIQCGADFIVKGVNVNCKNLTDEFAEYLLENNPIAARLIRKLETKKRGKK